MSKYEDALEKARELYETVAVGKNFFVEIFPELRESEDERIRKEIIDHLVREVGLYPGVDRKEHKWLRWLEKQKESLHIPETCKENADSFTDEDERVRKWIIGYANSEIDRMLPGDEQCNKVANQWRKVIAYLEKQKEQKPADLPPGFYFINPDGKKYYSKEFRYGDMKMKIVEDAQKEQKPTAKVNGEPIPTENYSVDIPCIEWSEEDEDFINMLILHFNYLIHKGGDSVETYKSYIEKLKSLRPPQYCENCKLKRSVEGWKPSEEQMRQLGYVAEQNKHNMLGQELMMLYNDLKKLM